MVEQNKMAEVWYIDENTLKHGNKVITKVDYEGMEVAILKSQRKYQFAEMLIKDEDDIYWNLGIAPIRFGDFIDTTIPENKQYCDRIKNIYETFDFKKYFERKINDNKYFNKCELKYIAKEHPDILSKAKQSRENFLQQKKIEEEKEKNRVQKQNQEKVKRINSKFFEKIEKIKLEIRMGQRVSSQDLKFYKDSKYENGLTSQNCFLYLAKQYGIDIPIATQGFINNRLVSYDFGNGNYLYNITKNKRPSIKIHEYLSEIYTKVNEEFKKEKSQTQMLKKVKEAR